MTRCSGAASPPRWRFSAAYQHVWQLQRDEGDNRAAASGAWDECARRRCCGRAGFIALTRTDEINATVELMESARFRRATGSVSARQAHLVETSATLRKSRPFSVKRPLSATATGTGNSSLFHMVPRAGFQYVLVECASGCDAEQTPGRIRTFYGNRSPQTSTGGGRGTNGVDSESGAWLCSGILQLPVHKDRGFAVRSLELQSDPAVTA
jgi:hypothetical protein